MATVRQLQKLRSDDLVEVEVIGVEVGKRFPGGPPVLKRPVINRKVPQIGEVVTVSAAQAVALIANSQGGVRWYDKERTEAEAKAKAEAEAKAKAAKT